MIDIHFYDSDEIRESRVSFVVMAARYQGKWVLCRHGGRTTLEFPGGHREDGETAGEAARRELYEETGATGSSLYPICIYSLQGYDGVATYSEAVYGKLYYAEITEMGKLPEMEIAEILLADQLPANWTYPLVQETLLPRVLDFMCTREEKKDIIFKY